MDDQYIVAQPGLDHTHFQSGLSRLSVLQEPHVAGSLISALDPRSLDPSLTATDQDRLMKSIEEIFDLEEEEQDGGAGAQDSDEMKDDDSEPVVDIEDYKKRMEKLKGVLSTLAQLWWSNSVHMDMAAEKLADGSRDPKWRLPLGDSGVLSFFLEILSTHTLRHTLKVHVLRLIGNSCADTDENRARVLNSNALYSVINQLQDNSLISFAVPVLYNICIDYEPAQQQASSCLLSKALIELISSPGFSGRPFLGYICKILDLLIAQSGEPDVASEDTATVLLKIAASKESPVDMEDFIALVSTAVLYLNHERLQRALIAHGGLDTALAVLVDSYTRFDLPPSLSQSSADEDDAKLLSQMRISLNQVLADISALPEFKVAVPVTSPFSAALRRWLSSHQLQLQVCACVMLGNLARSDEACTEFVHISKVHIPLVAVLSNSNDSQLLHAALGFLKNLALPLKNKEIIGATGPTDAGIFDVLPRLWQLDTLQQIQFSSVSLTRQLIISTYENLRKLTRRLSEDTDSPANNRSKLSLLITLFDRTDIEPIKMEIARLITATCRTFYSSHPNSGTDDANMERIRSTFLAVHPDFGRPLSFMVSQTKWPVVRSEGWFVFALMARTPAGAQYISDMMMDVAVFAPLVELLTGKTLVDYQPSPYSSTHSGVSTGDVGVPASLEEPSPLNDSEEPMPQAQAPDMVRIDRENALVMVNELLKNRGDEMAVMRRTLFEDLLKGGGELVVSYKEILPNLSEDVVPPNRRARSGLNIQQVVSQAHSELS